MRLFRLYFWKMRSKNTLSHFPARMWKEWGLHKGKFNGWTLHGHTHMTRKVNGKNINCCVEAWNYTPVNIDKIVHLIEQEEK
jgi:calcineurin-like phosphoesterase family protein